MSWKMFWQIVLLMVIGALILGSLKCGLVYQRTCWGKYLKGHPMMQQPMMQPKK